MAAIPAYVVGVLCIVGGITGFVRTRSIPSIVAGVSVGVLYLWSGDAIAKGQAIGVQGAVGASALLFFSSLPRIAKGPVPQALVAASALSGVYYGYAMYTRASRP